MQTKKDLNTEAYSELCQTSKMKSFCENNLQPKSRSIFLQKAQS